MDWKIIINIIATITGITGSSVGIKSLQSSSKTKEKIKNLEKQIIINQNQFNELKMHIMNIETKIDLIFMNINNSNEINITKQEREHK